MRMFDRINATIVLNDFRVPVLLNHHAADGRMLNVNRSGMIWSRSGNGLIVSFPGVRDSS
jgi:hypothetical protein